jgi:hypothetical protein
MIEIIGTLPKSDDLKEGTIMVREGKSAIETRDPGYARPCQDLWLGLISLLT